MNEPELVREIVHKGMRHIYKNNLHLYVLDEYAQEFLEYAAAGGIAIDDSYIWERCVNLLVGRKVPPNATTAQHAAIDLIVKLVVHPEYFRNEEAA